ncbi:mitochondrial processing peptidase beta subunit [Geranomyces michiganensis]|nr:mitochondrial processing peptidase beta subunit [Geranomyces michiganensis]
MLRSTRALASSTRSALRTSQKGYASVSAPLVDARPSTKTVKSTYHKSLSNIPETKVTKLSNGFTIASEANSNNQTATVGVWINAGSTSETTRTNGAAHFLEHLAFKGTKSRAQTELETQVENIGGHFGAYTGREQSAFYAQTLSSDVGTAVEILADVLHGQALNPDTIERQRALILAEVEKYENNSDKSQIVFDHLHASAFQRSSLARTVFGPTENIKSLTREDLATYISANFSPEKMVLSAAGGVQHDALVKLAEKHFGALEVSTIVSGKKEKPKFFGSDLRARFDDNPTAHVILAVEGASWTSPDYWALQVAQSIVGTYDRTLGAAPHVSSKLAAQVGKWKLANSFSAFSTAYNDTGLFGVYAVSEAKMNLDDLIHYIQQEWHRLAMSVTSAEVFRAKNQLKTAMHLALADGTNPIADDIGRQMLAYGKRLTPWEIDGLIEKVTAADVMKVARQYIYDQEVCMIGHGPVESLPDYNRVRSAQSPIYY